MVRKMSIIGLVLGAILLVCSQAAFAHGHTEVGDYEIEIGFHNEPAYQGQPNGLDLFVKNMQTGEMVNGLETTLKAEIIFGSSKMELPIEPQWEMDGAYTAYVVPSEAGDYTWHIFGMIEDTPVDVSMTSSPDTFGSVEPLSDHAFPAVVAATVSQVSGSAQTALIAAVIALILGLVGVILGVVALRAARSRPA